MTQKKAHRKWHMNIISWLIPKEKRFFDMIKEQSRNVLFGANVIEDMLEDYRDIEQKRRKVKEIEEKGDRMVHDIFKELNMTFITPIDREDISALTCSLDDILDHVEAVAERLVLYKIGKPPKYMVEFAKALQKATADIHNCISLLQNLKQAKRIRDYCKEINTLENEGDVMLRKAIAELFETGDPIQIIKVKELYEYMETAIDKCEDVADCIGNILVKYA